MCGSSACPALKKTVCGCCGRAQRGWYDRRVRQVRDLSCGASRIVLELEVRRVPCRSCGLVKRERLDFLADNPRYTKRFAFYVGRRCRQASIRTWPRSCGSTGTRSRRWRSSTCARSSPAPGAGPEGDRHRRDLDPQRPQLPHRGQRPGPRAADLVRRRGPVRGEHGAVLRLAGREQEPRHPPGGDGHVEAVPQRHRGACTAGGDPVRQVPHHAPSRRGARQGAQGRVRPAHAARTGASSRARSTRCCRTARTSPSTAGARSSPAGRQQAAQHRLPAQGDPSASSGTTSAKAGLGASSTTGGPASSGSGSSPTRSSPR